MSALDLSSNNGADVSVLLDRFKPRHLITHLYQSVELGGNGARFPIAHAAGARARGIGMGGYGWLFALIDGAKQVTDFLDTAERAGIRLGPTNPLWLDCEDYPDGGYPSLTTIRQAVQECQRRAVPCGIYSAAWWWVPRVGNSAEFSALPLWAAIYDNRLELTPPGFGGWARCAGKQYSGNPIDRSVFRAEFATEAAA